MRLCVELITDACSPFEIHERRYQLLSLAPLPWLRRARFASTCLHKLLDLQCTALQQQCDTAQRVESILQRGTLVQTFWDEHALTVDVDELAAMALELFQKRAEAFAEDSSAEVNASDVTAQMIHDHYGGFHAAGSAALKASLKLAASYHMEILRQSKRNLFEAGKRGKKTVVAASAKLIGECTKHLIHLDEHWAKQASR